MDYQKFIQASQQLERAASALRHSRATELEQEVAEALGRDDRERAIAVIEAHLERNPNVARWWHELALLRQQEGESHAAQAAWFRALIAGRGDVPLLHRIGRGLATAGHEPVAIAEQAWASHPEEPAPSIAIGNRLRMPDLSLACLEVLRENWPPALSLLTRIMLAQPSSRQALHNLAFLLERKGHHGTAQCFLALHLLARGQAHEAVDAFEAAPVSDARSKDFLGDFVRALRVTGNERRALEILGSIAHRDIPRVAYVEWADALMDLGRHDEAVAVLHKGADSLDDPGLALQAQLILPAVPPTQEFLEQAHQRVRRNMLALDGVPVPGNATALAKLERSLGPNFFLPYIGDACVEEARSYASFAERVVQARFPEFSTLPVRRRAARGPVRIGCATSFVNHHVVMKCFAGWLEHPEREGFEIHLFPLATEQNEVTDYLANLVDVFHPPTSETEEAALQIRQAGLDLLVYPEIGMDPLSFRLAAMRLAPVQCVAGGHPMTTGLSTLDYFLSAAAAEPVDATVHYTEQLVALPGMGIYMAPPTPPRKGLARTDFDIPQDRVVYLSTQNLFKYLPIHDGLYARIAECVEDAIFVFMEGHYPTWTHTFSKRLRESFTSRGLSPDNYLRFIPRQDYDKYLALNAVSDVFLDPPGGFSGGMTSRDALACGLPLVTLPGGLMRNRQSTGLLAEIGVGDTVATDLDDYLRIAIEIGLNAPWRKDISQRIQERRHLLFDDTRCLAALTTFLRQAARER